MTQHRDYVLIQGWLSGNSSIGEKLILESYEKVLRFVAYMIDQHTRNFQETIEEITADAFTRAIEKIQEYNGSGSFYTWVCGFAKFCIKEKLRKIFKESQQHGFIEGVEYFENHEPDDFANPEDILCEKEEYEAVRIAFLSLKEEYKEIIHFRLLKGLKYSEISALSGKSVSSLESLFRRALNALEKEFFEFYKNT